jgi:hypothetical protein
MDKATDNRRKLNNQHRQLVQAFSERPKTMLQASIETRILRGNITRWIAVMKRKDNIHLVKTDICPISKHRAGFYRIWEGAQ